MNFYTIMIPENHAQPFFDKNTIKPFPHINAGKGLSEIVQYKAIKHHTKSKEPDYMCKAILMYRSIIQALYDAYLYFDYNLSHTIII